MNDDNKIKIDISTEDEVQEKEIESETPDTTDSEDQAPAEEAPELELEERLQLAEKEAKETYDRFLRLSAEFENFKKRTTREMNDFRKYANESLIRELLSVVDNLERALQTTSSGTQTDTGVIEGVEMTHREILKIFEKFNVQPIDALDQTFDPKFHQAVMQESVEDKPENTVIQELQRGYLMHDRLIRPSMVVVSKAPARAQDKAAENNLSENQDEDNMR
jgi:molecular chaperone GrpE